MTHAADVARFVEEHMEEVLADLDHLVGMESPSTDKALLDAALSGIETWAVERLGEPASRTRHDGGDRGDVLELTWEGSGASGAVLSVCHYDTVWPEGTLADWPLTRDGDVLTGPGVLDMKAGIVQTVWMLKALRELGVPHADLHLLLTGDEEIGSSASRHHIEAAAQNALVTMIAEPSAAGAVKVQRKGTVMADVTVTGIQSHAGLDPEKGASAIHELARLVGRIADLADPERGTTVNVGVITGGTGRNVVAEKASCQVDVRVQKAAEEDRVVEALEALRVEDERCSIEMEIDRNRPPMNPTERTEEMLALLVAAGQDMGVEVTTQAVGGASDGNFIAALGLPVIDGLGGVGAGPHARHEHITVSGLPRQTALMAGLVEQLAGG
ncbi:M20 family metallopeptidase [Kytococcus sedentarius]|uniref:M20 family metallopeptidase n=1 Tax=Kytococcus sedentarius TaxID=1276 RepID=UPI0035BBCC2F